MQILTPVLLSAAHCLCLCGPVARATPQKNRIIFVKASKTVFLRVCAGCGVNRGFLEGGSRRFHPLPVLPRSTPILHPSCLNRIFRSHLLYSNGWKGSVSQPKGPHQNTAREARLNAAVAAYAQLDSVTDPAPKKNIAKLARDFDVKYISLWRRLQPQVKGLVPRHWLRVKSFCPPRRKSYWKSFSSLATVAYRLLGVISTHTEPIWPIAESRVDPPRSP